MLPLPRRIILVSLAFAVFLSAGFIWTSIQATHDGLQKTKEGFDPMASNAEWKQSNEGKMPWNRHPIHDSVPVDPQIRYPNAYYNELSNAEYEHGLRKLFQAPCTTLNAARAQESKANYWRAGNFPPQSPYILDAYTAFLAWFKQILDSQGVAALRLPGEDPSQKLQIVHDRLMNYAVHLSRGEGETDDDGIRLELEMILYRYGKYHGKHVRMVVLAHPRNKEKLSDFMQSPHVLEWSFVVPVLSIEGVVYEDRIGLHPVQWQDGMDIRQLKIPISPGLPEFDKDKEEPYPTVLMDNSAVVSALEKQNAAMRGYLESEIATGKRGIED